MIDKHIRGHISNVTGQNSAKFWRLVGLATCINWQLSQGHLPRQHLSLKHLSKFQYSGISLLILTKIGHTFLFDQNIFFNPNWIHILLNTNVLFTKSFGGQIFFYPKFFWTQHFWVKNFFFDPKFFLDPNFFWTQSLLRPKLCLDPA